MLTVLHEAREKIAKKGYAVLPSSRLSDKDQICVHTVGMASMGLADLVIYMGNYGEGPELAVKLITDVANFQTQQGKYTHGRVLTKEVWPDYDENDFVSLTLLQVDPFYLDSIFSLNKVLLRDKSVHTIEAFQIAYPDSAGRFPWVKGSEMATMRLVGRPPE